RIVARLDSYVELSPSRTGLHVLVRATLNGGRNRTPKTPWGGEFEVYDRTRFFCVTGQRVSTRVDIEERQAELDALLGEMFPPMETPRESSRGGFEKIWRSSRPRASLPKTGRPEGVE